MPPEAPPAAAPSPAPAPAAPPEGGTPPAAPPAAAPPAAPPADPPPVNYFAELPDNWRQNMVELGGFEGDDATKRTGQLERVLDMGTLAKNYFSAQDRIRTGELSNGLPADPTSDQLTDWRTANGVPETPEAYEIALDDGLVLGEDDNRIMAEVFKVGHAGNVSTEVMSGMVNAMMQAREVEADLVQKDDGIHTQQTTQQLKTAWAGDYQTNLNMIQNLVNQLPETVRDEFATARLGDGRAIFNSPEVMVFFADMARKLNPAGTVVPNANNPTQAISDEIAKLEDRMADPDWHKDKVAQDRYMELITAREAMNK